MLSRCFGAVRQLPPQNRNRKRRILRRFLVVTVYVVAAATAGVAAGVAAAAAAPISFFSLWMELRLRFMVAGQQKMLLPPGLLPPPLRFLSFLFRWNSVFVSW